MAEPTGLRIVAIHNARRGAQNADEEWVQIDNDGSQQCVIDNWEVTEQTEGKLLAPIYRFPATLANGSTWHFDPGESIYIFTGHGQDVFVAKPSDQGRPQFHFYWNRDAMVWNNSGDRVYLRSKDGRLVAFPFPVP